MKGKNAVNISLANRSLEEITVARKQKGTWQFTHWFQGKPQNCLEKEQGVMQESEIAG